MSSNSAYMSGIVFLPPANEVWGKVIFSVACVKNSVHSGGVPGQVLPPGQVPPLGRYSPRTGTPLGRYTPGQVHPLGRYTSRQVHPREQRMLGNRVTSGRYASYWNAFLLKLHLEELPTQMTMTVMTQQQ